MRICQQTILMKYHDLLVILEKAAIFEIVVCCKLQVALYGLNKQVAKSQISHTSAKPHRSLHC